MSYFWVLMKMNIKLLFRNKAFLFFLCVTPIVSVFILNLKLTDIEERKQTGNAVKELPDIADRAVYVTDGEKYTVKVYDASGSALSDYVLESLADMGMFSVCRCKVEGITEQEALAQAQTDAFSDRAGVILYLKADFDEGVTAGDFDRAVQLYRVSEDERYTLFADDLSGKLSLIHRLAMQSDGNRGRVLDMLLTVKEAMPDKQVVTVKGQDEILLDGEDERYREQVGYSFAIITLGFLFCGVCIAYTVIEEQENKVYIRIVLSKAGRYEYLFAKLTTSLCIALLQTGIIAIYLLFAVPDFGIGIPAYLLIIFLMGLVFDTLSLCVGVLMGEVMGANFAVFTIWSVSALLSGLYFPLGTSAQSIRMLSNLMPQRWFLKGAEMLMIGDKSAYPMLLCITAAYLIVILSAGMAGLKMRQSD